MPAPETIAGKRTGFIEKYGSVRRDPSRAEGKNDIGNNSEASVALPDSSRPRVIRGSLYVTTEAGLAQVSLRSVSGKNETGERVPLYASPAANEVTADINSSRPHELRVVLKRRQDASGKSGEGNSLALVESRLRFGAVVPPGLGDGYIEEDMDTLHTLTKPSNGHDSPQEARIVLPGVDSLIGAKLNVREPGGPTLRKNKSQDIFVRVRESDGDVQVQEQSDGSLEGNGSEKSTRHNGAGLELRNKVIADAKAHEIAIEQKIKNGRQGSEPAPKSTVPVYPVDIAKLQQPPIGGPISPEGGSVW